MQPQSFTWRGSYDARVTANEIHLVYTRTDHDAAAIKRDYESTLGLLKQNLVSLKASADQFNAQLEQQLRQLVRERKNKLLADAQMAGAIGIPIKRRDGIPTTYAVPAERRRPKIERPRPRAFEKMGEEDLRTHFLVQLNGQYEGRATEETFNFQGKIDIVIRDEGRNVFIAECKFWGGEK